MRELQWKPTTRFLLMVDQWASLSVVATRREALTETDLGHQDVEAASEATETAVIAVVATEVATETDAKAVADVKRKKKSLRNNSMLKWMPT